jgi:Mg2+-importing ATPase
VLRSGVDAGRRTFANTLKYISITTSANFGNMLSMALATPFLPFLPLQAKQILLNNFLSDLPSMAIATDRVDAEQVRTSEHWDIASVRSFMIVFGLISSIFDILTFALLLQVWHADEKTFQTAWFVVSLLTEVVIVLVLRTRNAVFRSRPGRLLAISTLIVTAAAVSLPFIPPIREIFGFVSLPMRVVAELLLITVGYVAATEFTKIRYYSRHKHRT